MQTLPRMKRLGLQPWLWFALVAACQSAPPAGTVPHFATATVTVASQGLLPTNEVRIPTFATVVFKNELTSGDITVQIARPYTPSAGCTTALGFHSVFQAVAEASDSDPVPPQGVVSLCFHHAGSFPYTVKTPAGERVGTIVVGGVP